MCRAAAAVVATAAALCVSACGGSSRHDWPVSNADLSSTRAVGGSIDASNVAKLRPKWRFRFTAPPSFSGIFASTPVSDGSTVYVQDLRSNVFALDLESGALRWAHRYRARNDGPNGLAVDRGTVFGATDSDAFALDAASGRELWRRHLTGPTEQFVDVAPLPWRDLVLTSTIGVAPGGRGAVYALDRASGRVHWRFDTVRDPWRFPREAGGGGFWYAPSVDGDGLAYGGNSNPAPWGGTPKRPNGASFPGPVPYTDSLLVLDAATGRLRWYDQATPHDVRDYDFEASPVLVSAGGHDLVVGAGKGGRVIAWDRGTHRRVWSAAVGRHLNDEGPLPRRRVEICPGLLGGVETPLAYADGYVFVPVVDLCVHGSAVSYDTVDNLDVARGRGRLVALGAASGRHLWERRFPSPDFGCATVANDVVFTSTYDGTVYGLAARDGRIVWRYRMRAAINACPAIVGGTLLVGAGAPRPRGTPELVAFSLP